MLYVFFHDHFFCDEKNMQIGGYYSINEAVKHMCKKAFGNEPIGRLIIYGNNQSFYQKVDQEGDGTDLPQVSFRLVDRDTYDDKVKYQGNLFGPDMINILNGVMYFCDEEKPETCSTYVLRMMRAANVRSKDDIEQVKKAKFVIFGDWDVNVFFFKFKNMLESMIEEYKPTIYVYDWQLSKMIKYSA